MTCRTLSNLALVAGLLVGAPALAKPVFGFSFDASSGLAASVPEQCAATLQGSTWAPTDGSAILSPSVANAVTAAADGRATTADYQAAAVGCAGGFGGTRLGGSVSGHLLLPVRGSTALRVELGLAVRSHVGRMTWSATNHGNAAWTGTVPDGTPAAAVGNTAAFIGLPIAVAMERELASEGLRPYVGAGLDLMPGVRASNVGPRKSDRRMDFLENAYQRCTAEDCTGRVNEAPLTTVALGAHAAVGARFGESPFFGELRYTLLGLPGGTPSGYEASTRLADERLDFFGLRVGMELH